MYWMWFVSLTPIQIIYCDIIAHVIWLWSSINNNGYQIKYLGYRQVIARHWHLRDAITYSCRRPLLLVHISSDITAIYYGLTIDLQWCTADLHDTVEQPGHMALDQYIHYTDVTSVSWRLKSPASQITGGCLFNGFIRLTSKKTWKLCITGPGITGGGGFPSQRDSNA